MKSVVYLEYCFLLESGTYPHLDLFEKHLAEFLKERGLEAEIINSTGGYAGRRILHIKKIEEVKLPTPHKKVKTPKAQFDKFRK